MVRCGPVPDWSAEVWMGPAGGWALPADLTDDDRVWVRGQLALAGARRSELLEGVAAGVRVIASAGVSLLPDPDLAQTVWQ